MKTKTLIKKLTPNEAVVRLLREFRILARSMAPKDRALQDDLVQEMALAVLQTRRMAHKTYFRRVAEWRACDVLRRAYRRMPAKLRRELRNRK